MLFRKLTMIAAGASLLAFPADEVQADSRDFAAGIVAGVVGSAIVRNAQKPRRVVRKSTQKVYKKPGISQAQRAENREVQTSLNYFSFPAGSPDGIFGRKTRSAVSGYQTFLGYPATGQLTQFEKDFLLQSYHRAIAGGAATVALIASDPLGPRGLLIRYRDEAAGTVAVRAPAPAPALPVTQEPEQPTTVAQPLAPQTPPATVVAAAPQPAAPALPNFLGTTEVASLASHCNQVSLITSTNGGFITEANLVDASFALNEQFCLARTYAIAEGEKLISAVQGFTPQQIAQQCESLGPTMAPHVAALSLKPAAQVSAEVGQFVLASGMAPAQLAGTAKICLSVGYRTDDMDVAVGSALLLSSLGQPVYAELMGHHLSQGFGVTKRVDLSQAWYQVGLDAVDQGATPVFNPGDNSRNALLRKAVFQGNGQAQAGTAPTVQPAAALPSFGIQN